MPTGVSVVLLHEGHGPAQRFAEILKDADIPARVAESIDDASDSSPTSWW